ncbi:MAG: hypothetical protein RXR44_04775 [Vulcanisaeta sp.]
MGLGLRLDCVVLLCGFFITQVHSSYAATPLSMHLTILLMVLPFLIMINVMSVALSTKVKMTENGLIIETGGGDVCRDVFGEVGVCR